MTRLAVATGTALLLALAIACRGASEPPAGAADPNTPARRVVTLAPSITELVLALGAADRLVGVTRFDDAPEVREVARVGGFNDPSVERLLALRPDLVLAQPSPGNRGAVEALRRSGVTVLVLPLERSLADVLANAGTVAARLGTLDAERRLAERLGKAAARARERSERRGRIPRVAVAVGLSPLVVAGPGSFLHDLLTLAGAANAVAASAQDYPHVAPTTLLAADPPLDALLLAGLDLHGETGGPGLPPELAVRARSLSSKGFLQPGPRAAEALDELADVLDGLAAGDAR